MKKISFSLIAFAFPCLTMAAYADFSYFGRMIESFGNLLNTAVVVLISLAVVWFIWNVFGYIRAAKEEDKIEAAKGMLWGIVGLAVIVSVWGLVAILQSTFGLRSSGGAAGVSNLLPTR